MTNPTRLQTALTLLQQNARPQELEGMARFGISGEGRLGLALWDTGIPDARIVASMVAEPALLTSRQMDAWVKGLAAWDMRCAN